MKVGIYWFVADEVRFVPEKSFSELEPDCRGRSGANAWIV